MSQPPADRHPGYGQNPDPYPPQPAPTPYPAQSQPHPGYGANPSADAPRHPGYGPNPTGAPGASGAPAPHPGSGPSARNPLGLAALLFGAAGPVLGFLFIFVQAGVFAAGGPGAIGPVSAAQSVLVGLTSLVALILGLVVIARPGAPKALASAGLALGAAGLLGVMGGLLYPVIISAMYV